MTPHWPMLVALLCLSASAAAQQPGLEIPDALDDHVQRVGDQTFDAPLEHVDIASLVLEEQEGAYRFTLHAAPDEGGGSDWNLREVFFTHGGQRYVVSTTGSLEHIQQAGSGNALLYSVDGQGERRFLRGVPEDLSESPPWWQVTVPREAMPDTQGAFPREGSILQDFYAITTGGYYRVGSQVIYTEDDVPDGGAPSETYTSVLGVPRTGSAYLSSVRPTASSNGEASTFVFPFQANNLDDQTHAYTLRTESVPERWEASLWPDHVVVPGGGNVSGSIILSIPFNHVHGERQTLDLVMENEDDSGDSHRLGFGMSFHAVPQPTGHHSAVWLHSRAGETTDPVAQRQFGDGSRLYMNTLEDDAEDDSVPVAADTNVRPLDTFVWTARLSPSFATGLAWIEDEAGTLAFDVSTQVPHTNARVDATLYVEAPNDTGALQRTVVAAGQVDGLTLEPRSTTSLEIELTPTITRFEHVPKSELYLEVSIDSDHPTVITSDESPEIEPGGRMDLPLLEYRDPLVGIHGPPTAFHIRSPDLYAQAPPGATVVLPVTVEAVDAVSLDLELKGVNDAWARLAGPADFRLDAGATQDVAVIVDIPETAAAGSVADLVLRLRTGDTVTLTRFLVEVDPDAVRDDAALAGDYEVQPGKESPAMASLVAIAALGWAAWRRSRR